MRSTGRRVFFTIINECHLQSALWFVSCYSSTFQHPVRCLAWCLFSELLTCVTSGDAQPISVSEFSLCLSVVLSQHTPSFLCQLHTTETKLVATTNLRVSHTCNNAVDRHEAGYNRWCCGWTLLKRVVRTHSRSCCPMEIDRIGWSTVNVIFCLLAADAQANL